MTLHEPSCRTKAHRQTMSAWRKTLWNELRCALAQCKTPKMWASEGIYPTADGWIPPAWPSNEEILAQEDLDKAKLRKSLVKRQNLRRRVKKSDRGTAIVKGKHIETVLDVDFMKKWRFSLMATRWRVEAPIYKVWPLKESSKLSGRGDNRSYVRQREAFSFSKRYSTPSWKVCWVFYEQQDELSVRVLASSFNRLLPRS